MWVLKLRPTLTNPDAAESEGERGDFDKINLSNQWFLPVTPSMVMSLLGGGIEILEASE